MLRADFNDTTPEEVIERYPRIIAHLIAESLGYFTPRSAAYALIYAKQGEPYFCEWYSYIVMKKWGDAWDRKRTAQVTREVLEYSIKNRHSHKGYMASYKQALAIVKAAIEGNEPTFASWF